MNEPLSFAVCDSQAVTRGRLEAFTDAVIAIVMTIMVLDLRSPAGHGFSDLKPLLPKLLVYALSFTFLAIYWNNHHHLMHVVERIDSRVLWANMGLLFSLSLTPAATAWFASIRETQHRSWSMGWSCFFLPPAIGLYIAVAVVWLVPDRRITRVIERSPKEEH